MCDVAGCVLEDHHEGEHVIGDDHHEAEHKKGGNVGGTVALSFIEHEGKEYNFGDEVPGAVAKAHPTAVGPAPLAESDIRKMSKAELQEQLLQLTGNVAAAKTIREEAGE